MLTGWKTIIVGGALALIGFLQGVDWTSIIPNNPQTVGWVTSGIGIVMVVLRMITSTPVGKAS